MEAQVEVRVIGPLEALRERTIVALPPKGRRVLARLALAAGATVSDGDVRDAVWPVGAPPSADKTVAGYVHRLRQALGADVITRRPTGYGLEIARVGLDVGFLDHTVALARAAVVAGDHDAATAAFRRAAALFRGIPFEDLDDVDEAVVERARLRELRACAEEELHEILLADGATREVIPALEALAAREPTRERAWAQLMRAYAGSGRQADALDAYSRVRRTLAVELGIEPGPQLQALQRRLLDHDEELFEANGVPVAPLRGRPLDRLVGRDDDLARIAAALADHRLVSLVGSGGAGKTRLALRVAESTPHAHVVELAPVGEDGVVAALLRGVGLQDHAADAPVEAVARWCDARPALVVLDNCEHVMDRVASLVSGLLACCPDLRVLTTSRERLRVRGEIVIDVEPLRTPESDADIDGSPAVALFVERATEAGVRVDLANADERSAVATVCCRLDGLPLAIELGAAQLRTRSLIELRDDLGSLDLPVARRDLPARQQSLDALVAWSEALLDPPAVAALRRLAVFRGDFDAAAAAVVMAGEPIAPGTEIAALADLVEASLVIVVRRPGAPNRYRLLETVRRHAEQRLIAHGEHESTMDALVQWAEQVVVTIERRIRTPRQDEAMAVASIEQTNITAAFDHALASGDARRALRLAATVPMGLPTERRVLLSRLLAADAATPAELRARAWMTLANLASDVGDGTRQAAAAAEALAAARVAGDEAQVAWARYFLVLGTWAEGRLEALDDLIDEAIVGFRRIGSEHGIASMHWIGSQVAADAAQATELAERAVTEFRRLAIPSGLAHALEGGALVALRTADFATVQANLREAVTIVRDAGNSGCMAHCLESVAALAVDCGWHDDALRLTSAAAVLREQSGHGMRVWEQEGHRRVESILGAVAIGSLTAATDVDVVSAAALAHDVLADRPD